MDFLDPQKRKQHTRRLYIGYILMAVAIGLGALILLFASFGYGVDRKGNVFQNGLVFLSSTPEEAQVKIKNQKNTYSEAVVTNERMELKADTYSFQFLKKGYKPWSRTLEIRGGSIERLVYPFLVPEKLETKVQESFASSPGMVTQTPDRKTILVQSPDSLVNFLTYSTDDASKEPRSFTIPSGLFPEKAAAKPLQVVEWSTNNRNVIVRYDTDTGPEFIIIDRDQPEQSFNVNNLFELPVQKLFMLDKDPGRLYLLHPDGRLFSAEVENKSTRLIANNVKDFKPHGSRDILYVTSDQASEASKVVAVIRSNNKTQRIRELPVADSYLLDLAQYSNQWYIIVGSKADDEAFIYRDPIIAFSEQNKSLAPFVRTIRLNNPERTSFSANTRFIAVQSGQQFVIFDAEKDSQYRFTVNPNYDDVSKVSWMDGHRLMGITSGKVLIIDFDGTNQQTLSASYPDGVPMFNDNYEFLHTVAPSTTPGQASLLTANMRVE